MPGILVVDHPSSYLVVIVDHPSLAEPEDVARRFGELPQHTHESQAPSRGDVLIGAPHDFRTRFWMN